MPTFRYRYVNFGTNFQKSKAAQRSEADAFKGEFARDKLCRNELALDVGGMCGGFDGDDLSVIDHHFPGEPFPSASAAVLHKARLISEQFNAAESFPVIWLVTHTQPDFDAFCSMYLARAVIEAPDISDIIGIGLDHRHWEPGKINWYEPKLPYYPASIRWMILLASYASRVDHGRRIECPKHRALHSMLYAALKRGRDYESNHSGATEFFDAVKNALETEGLNPLTDFVLAGSSTFRPELEMLEEDMQAYFRDIRRARKAIVHLQWHTPGHFHDLFSQLEATPLLDEQQEIRPEHLRETGQRRQTDGIYMRDPECLLFKEWARMDLENSSMGQGFLFTAVAYSKGRPGGELNQTDYFFSIDPERAEGRHLYTLWARLQAREIREICDRPGQRQALEQPDPEPKTARGTFEFRAGAFSALFNDPWFDGSNYNCTIVATPNRGTLIDKPGGRGDLEDDKIVDIVRHELEDAIYASQPPQVDILDVSASDPVENEQRHEIEHIPPIRTGHFRFGRIAFSEDVNLHSGDLGRQIGTQLWRILHPKAEEGLPADLLTRHILTTTDWMGVWSRTGVIVAYKVNTGKEAADRSRTRFREIIELARSVQERFKPGMEDEHIGTRMKSGDELTRRIAKLRYELILPENRLLSQFFDAINVSELLQTMRDMLLGLNTHTTAEVQTKVEWLEIFLVGFYGTELARSVVHELHLSNPVWALIIIVGAGALFTGVTAGLLKPWQHKRSRNLIWLLGLAMLAYVLALVGAAKRYPDETATIIPDTIKYLKEIIGF
jgi:hypothetical protein